MLNENSAKDSWVALLGRRYTPEDGVEDYSTYLGKALERRGILMKIARVEWAERGWLSALFRLRRDCAEWRGKWVLLQYTALSWSRRGFPIGSVLTLGILKRCGAHCAVIFHERAGLGGPRWIDRIRATCQNWIVRSLHRRADRSIFTAPLDTIAWLPKNSEKASFIPIGANIPEPAARPLTAADRNGAGITIAVFCLSDPPNLQNELEDISQAVRAAATDGENLRLVFLGRGTAEASKEIVKTFSRIPVRVSNLGLQDGGEVSRILSDSDVMLCIRGELFPGRGSAIAGIACGLPIIGYGLASKIFPLSEAGVQLVPYGDREALGSAFRRVLVDPQFREQLRARSRRAQEEHFSWDVIAEKFCVALQNVGTTA
jgi:glycosyltransferase involved in cell wall biosynthesis